MRPAERVQAVLPHLASNVFRRPVDPCLCQVLNPKSKSWQSTMDFVPQKICGYTVTGQSKHTMAAAVE